MAEMENNHSKIDESSKLSRAIRISRSETEDLKLNLWIL